MGASNFTYVEATWTQTLVARLWVHLKYFNQHTAIAALAHGTRNYPADTTKFGCLLG
jgi:hypothetical protein